MHKILLKHSISNLIISWIETIKQSISHRRKFIRYVLYNRYVFHTKKYSGFRSKYAAEMFLFQQRLTSFILVFLRRRNSTLERDITSIYFSVSASQLAKLFSPKYYIKYYIVNYIYLINMQIIIAYIFEANSELLNIIHCVSLFLSVFHAFSTNI